jgi:predicted MFS family arabinose efflux permease
MYPAFQNMFVNLAEHNQRGTANSSILTAWDAGLGLGVLCGGFFAEYFGYDTAFWVAVAVNACGAVYYYFRVRSHYLSHRLR